MRDEPILALETSTQRGSVALGMGSQLLGRRELSADRRHTPELIPAIGELLAQSGVRAADVGVVCFSRGPGSFTGLRVAATLVRMWQSAVGSRVVAVPTLDVIAANARTCPETPSRVAVMVDARAGRVFGAVFVCDETGVFQATADAALCDARAWLAELERPCTVLGDAVALYADELCAAGLTALPEEYAWPDARNVLELGSRRAAAGILCSPDEIVPAYLRAPECEEVYEQRRAAARQRRGP